MPPPALIDSVNFDTSKVQVDLEGIRRSNPQRFEMEHLSAIVLIDERQQLIVGYKDVGHHEFWVRGHMPSYPLMPGILMCETAAQICSYYSHHVKLIDQEAFIGFGGMEDVRFRGQVRPGQRFVIAAKAVRLNRRQTTFDTQGFVDGNMVFHGRIIGVAIPDPSATA